MKPVAVPSCSGKLKQPVNGCFCFQVMSSIEYVSSDRVSSGEFPPRPPLYRFRNSSDVLIFATLERLSHDDIFPPRSLRITLEPPHQGILFF